MAGIEDGADFDPLTVPAVMPVTVRRIAEGGFPTQFLLDYEQALQQWMRSNTANTNKRLTLVSAELGDVNASVETLAEAYATSEEAFASYKVTVTANFAAVNASVATESTARSTADTALATQITALNSNLGSTNANLSAEITARANADSAISSSVNTLSTTVGGHTSSISSLTSSVNGLGVKYAITGFVGGSFGGFVFTGVRRADGVGANFLLEITSNVVIHGDLTLNGTLTNLKAADRAWTQGIGAQSSGASASVSLTTRGAAQVQIVANFNGLSGNYVSFLTPPGLFTVYRNGIALQQVGNNFEASGTGGSAAIAFQQTGLLVVDTPPAGFNTYTATTTNGAGLGGVTITAVELSK